MTKNELIEFENDIAECFARGQVNGPVHLSGGNEDQLIEIFKGIDKRDWICSNYRSHYHALLHGLPVEWLKAEILAGRSMSLNSVNHRFYTSAIVGGALPIAVGIAAGIKRRGTDEQVWCFSGDMASSIGAFHDAEKYSSCNGLPLTFIVEDNGLSCDTPTYAAWGCDVNVGKIKRYCYQKTMPHIGHRKGITF